MKVVKYHLKAKIEKAGVEPITLERRFRKLVNARKFIDELVKEDDVKCTPLNRSETLLTKQCEGTQTKYFFEITIERIKKPKAKEEQPKKEGEEKKQQQETTSSQSP
ncbi:hypothetical protein V6M85_01260 [Sulfolobus tengchongensis]|uniref:Uncharacterized protein n=1 Tax=Sulfolobus tengchongensis TaxID=207809 RepID=A0AAX4L1B1_9CREN